MREVVIVEACRTAIGKFGGTLKALSDIDFGPIPIREVINRTKIAPDQVDEVIYASGYRTGDLPINSARVVAVKAGIPIEKPQFTISKACAGSIKAVTLAVQVIKSGDADIIIAGGMESMSNAPYLLPKARGGYRLGHGDTVMDHMFLDGLEDAYDRGKLMGCYAEDTATKYQFTRDTQDDFAIESLSRAKKAIEDGSFKTEVEPVTVKTRKGEVVVKQDEQPLKANIDKIRALKPAFTKDGTVTPANSSSISDGGAALVMMRLSEAENRALTPIAKIHGHTTHAQEPAWFTTAPIGAVEKLMDKTGWSKDEVDLYEINEAFASLCIGGGEATAIAVERAVRGDGRTNRSWKYRPSDRLARRGPV